MGEETRTCLDDGEWSGTAPFCRRKSEITSYMYVCLAMSIGD